MGVVARKRSWGFGWVASVLGVAVMEIAVRLAAIEPLPWSVRGGQQNFAGIEVDPLLGPLPKPGWAGRWPGIGVASEFEVEVDSHGFRATGYPASRVGSKKVAFLGDSATFGWGVATRETYVARLDQLQRTRGPQQFTWVNAAYPGHSAVSGSRMLQERVLPERPDWTVLAYSANNAFRFTLLRDVARFRLFELRKLALRSRLLHVLAAWWLHRTSGDTPADPRNKLRLGQVPVQDLRRVASPGEFEAATRDMVKEVRAAGGRVLFLVFPRAMQVSSQWPSEDAARTAQVLKNRSRRADRLGSDSPVGLLELSCLDPRGAGTLAKLLERADHWRPLRPGDEVVRRKLRRGAMAFMREEFDSASAAFREGVALAPESPIAHYDLAVAEISNGDIAAGLRRLKRAERLACSAFLQYQATLWRLAVELSVPVVDLVLAFQTDGGRSLFLDGAHPNALGHRLIAEALWPVLKREALGLRRG